MRRSFIDEAISYAEKSEIWAQHHGAVVIFRGKVVGRGYNKYSVENVNKVNRYSVHAEVDAINNALRKISSEDLKKSTLIVVRKLKSSSKMDEDSHTISKSNKLMYVKRLVYRRLVSTALILFVGVELRHAFILEKIN